MSDKSKISVIMPVYKGEKFIRQAMDSILAQTFKEFELLIINDGNKDRSKEIIESYNDPRIRLIHNENPIGLSPSRNLGFTEAKAEYIALLDSDDIAYKERLQKQFDFMEKHPDFGLLSSWVKVIDEKGRSTGSIRKSYTPPEQIPSKLLFINEIAQSSVFLRKSCLPQKRYRSEFLNEDYDLWVRIAARAKIACLPKILTKYRTHKKSMSSNNSPEREGSRRKIILYQLNNLGIIPTPDELEIHLCLGEYPFQSSLDLLTKVESWLLKLIQANQQIQYYPISAFTEVCKDRWFTICHESTALGWLAWQRYWKSPLSKQTYISPTSLLKFMMKCLLSIKKEFN